MREAVALEPTSPWVLAVLAVAYTDAGQRDSALAVAERGYAIDSTNWVANAVLGWAKFSKGMIPEGTRLMEAARRLGGEHHSLTIGNLGEMYARAGRVEDAQRIADELAQRVRKGQASRSDLARIYEALGNSAMASYWRAQPSRSIEEPDAESEHCPKA
jgi:Flp pilus assembly protein TadD